jgi:FkbM family methyltransferase
MGYRLNLLRDYWRVFGPAGLILGAAAKLMPRPMTKCLTPPGARHTVSLRIRTSDVPTFREVFLQEGYRLSLRTAPRVIVDAGANIGLTSVYFAIRFPQARIVAVEPEASNCAMLVANARPYPSITVVQAALWNENAMIDVIDPGKGKWGFQTRNSGNDAAGPAVGRVPAVTVDALMRAHAIDFIDVLKIDIEGAEREVFADPSAWIDRVGVIVIELHERLKSGCNRSVYCATNGFDVEWMQREHSMCFARSTMLSTGEADVLAKAG